MKDYKLLLAGLFLLLLMILIAVFTWLWINNRKNMDPLPILASESESMAKATEDGADTSADRTLYLQIEDSLQTPLDHVITSFESRYPHVQVFTNYVPASTLLTLPNDNNNGNDNEGEPIVAHADIIIADNILPSERLLPLQTKLKDAQNKRNQSNIGTENTTQDNADSLNVSDLFDEEDVATETSDNTEARRLNSFSYALKDEHALDGVILTHNTVAINFRNFLLSSTGQDILKKYDYYSIEGYKNSVDELFQPTSQAKKPLGDNGEDIADALSNGK